VPNDRKRVHAEEISRAVAELSENLSLGALDSTGYAQRARRTELEAQEILKRGASEFTVAFGGQVLAFPVVRFGPSVSSLNLFDYKELSILAIYVQIKGRLTRFLDLGSNIGVHSIVAAQQGAIVRSWEPDRTVSTIQGSLFREHCMGCTQIDAAAGTATGRAMFIHLDDNQTGSHLVGKKNKPYGPAKCFEVQVEDCRSDIDWADLVKMDVEGSESDILCNTSHSTLARTMIICEVTSAEHADRLFHYLRQAPVVMFAQKLGWLTPKNLSEMPSHHSDGALLIVGDSSNLASVNSRFK